ncbi:glycosyl hydrolase 43 family protein [Sphingomonas sp. Leaf24]|uniref:family 43 glycosylhydrolase n=1 Tax=unclassified Sphingomonas TaxID=196159 RepID=UPI0006F4F2DD|nr:MULTISPECIES: family 43 glycosylhydrolase [unclassified Sphingomonas]KQM18504.1 glycosyl hydrolase 43 family protein [Sphingomonas sp. Leaf5]KQM89265.1 glycosyl hydrolase 43 family protein [Sphingomonas sp. Leaf24]
MRKHLFLPLILLTSVAAAPAGNPQFQGADPHAMFIGNELWVFPTGGPGGSWAADRFGAFSTRDLKNWRPRGELIRRDQIGWITDDGAPEHFLWAPGVATRNGKYYLYFSVGPQNPTPSRIGVAVADRPEGPYRDSGRPLVTGGKGFEAIDPMVFNDRRSGKSYLYAGGSAGAKLRVWELKPDMVTIAREMPVANPPQFTEGAFLHERGGTYYLSYSHGRFNGPDYSVHYATAPSPVGPWNYRGPILTSDATHKGPGHHSFVTTPNGQSLIVYHRWENPQGGAPYRGERQVAVDRVQYARDGRILPIRMTDGAAAPTLDGK